MAVKVAGIWELNWNNPLNESWLWTFVLRQYDVMDWHMTPVTGILHNERYTNMVLTEHTNVTEMIDNLSADKSYTRVFLHEHGDTSLPDLEHPENAIYFFGNAGSYPNPQVKNETDIMVKIPTKMEQSVLWPHQCLLVVLYDRYIKSLQQSGE